MFLTLCIITLMATLMLASTQTSFGEAGRMVAPSEPIARQLSWVERIVYAVVLLCAAVLALTGIGTFVLTGGKAMTGWILMIHASVAPPFAIFVTLLAVIWADRCQFVQDNDSTFGLVGKLLYWLMVVLALVVILSAVFPMTPIFGTEGQELLDKTHRYSSILITIVLALQAVGIFARR